MAPFRPKAEGSDVPPIKTYTQEEQLAVRDELRECAENCSYIRELLTDYHVLRNQVSAALGMS